MAEPQNTVELPKDNNELVDKYSWIVRPCEMYKDELSDCKSFRSRLHQYFVFGSFTDCTQWAHDVNNCSKWTHENDIKAFRELVTSERIRQAQRLKANLDNDVWERRTEPPTDWNKPLPDWLAERAKTSYLSIRAEDVETKRSLLGSLCPIM